MADVDHVDVERPEPAVVIDESTGVEQVDAVETPAEGGDSVGGTPQGTAEPEDAGPGEPAAEPEDAGPGEAEVAVGPEPGDAVAAAEPEDAGPGEPAAESEDAGPGEPGPDEVVAGEAEAAVEAEPDRPHSPYDLPGDWYVIHSYSGYENKVKANLETRIRSMHMEDRIFEVHIPMEDVVEIKGGKKVTVPKKVFPGYILVRMTLDDDSWYAVRNTPGVTGFVGGTSKPTPLSRREVERFLGVQEEEEKVKPRFKPEWEVGDIVRVITGPFADFNGRIEDIDLDQSKVTVLVNIFGRDTPVELGFEDIQKS